MPQIKETILTPPLDGGECLQIGDGQRPGANVEPDNGRVIVTVDRPRMYRLVANEAVMPGSLKLIAREPGWSAFAFTFLSCVVT